MKQATKWVVVALAAAVLAGCVTRPQLTRDEWLAMTSRTYPGVTKEQALDAVERLLRLADGDDVQIAHTEDGFVATRMWSIYLVLVAGFGTDTWQVRASDTPQGAKLAVMVSTSESAVAPMPTAASSQHSGGNWYVGTSPGVYGRPVQGPALYEIFWARMDYLLGRRTTWMECAEAYDRLKLRQTWGHIEALCQAANVNDDRPAEAGPATYESIIKDDRR